MFSGIAFSDKAMSLIAGKTLGVADLDGEAYACRPREPLYDLCRRHLADMLALKGT
jgi:hypothetical protein